MDTRCQFVVEEVKGKRNLLRCTECQRGMWFAGDPARLVRRCIVKTAIPPPLVTRIKHFTVAAIAHELNGSPTCTQEQIDARLAICKACRFYLPDADYPDAGTCCHGDCGCNVGRQDRYLNKLAWADQLCPDGKWGAIACHNSPATTANPSPPETHQTNSSEAAETSGPVPSR